MAATAPEPAPVGAPSSITTTAPEGATPGPRWAHAATDAAGPPGSVPLGTPMSAMGAAPPAPGFPGMPGAPPTSPFGNGTVLPQPQPAPAAPAGQISLAVDGVIGVVACIGIAIGALLDWVRSVSSQHIPATFLYDLHTRARDPKIAHVLFAVAAFGAVASLVKDGRRWRTFLGLAGVVMSLAYLVQVWRLLSDAPGSPSYTDYVRFGPVVTLVSAGLLMISPAFGPAVQAPASHTTGGVTFCSGRSGSRSLTTAIAAAVALSVAWFGIRAFTGGDGRTAVSPSAAHFHALVHGKPQISSRVQTVLGAKISTTTAIAVTPGRFEEIAEDDMPAVVAAHDAKHSASDQFAHVLMRDQMLLPMQIESSKPATFQGRDALYEERASGSTKAAILYVFDGSRVFVIAAMSAKSSPKSIYDALVSSLKITG